MNSKHICKAPYQPQEGNGDLKVVLLVFACSFMFLSEISTLSDSAKIGKPKEHHASMHGVQIHASLLYSSSLIVCFLPSLLYGELGSFTYIL